jgi:hypothetical protein
MPFVAAGVRIREFDFTEFAQAQGLARLAVIGGASKGPLNDPIELTSEADMVRRFGKPLLNDYALHALVDFFKRGNSAIFTRVANGAATADRPISGVDGGVPAVKATGNASFTASTNPSDADSITLRKNVPTLALNNDNNGAVGNVVIVLAGAGVATRIGFTGMAGGTVSTPAQGTLNFIGSAQPADGDQIIISDGSTPVTFEFDSDASVVETPTLRQVVIGADAYATLTTLITKINAAAFSVSAVTSVVEKTFEFDNNATVTPGAVGVLIGVTAAATLQNLISAVNAWNATLGITAVDGTITIPQINFTRDLGGLAGNATIAKVGANIGVVGLSGGVDLVPGSAVTVMGLYATSPGTWGNSLKAIIQATTVINAPVNSFDLLIQAPVDDAGNVAVVERFNNLSLDSTSARYIEVVLRDGILGETNPSEYLTADVLVTAGSPTAGTYPIGVAPGNPGQDGITGLLPADYIGVVTGQTATGLKALSNPEKTDYNLLALPGVTHKDVLQAVLDMTVLRGDFLYLVDTPFGLSRAQAIEWHNGLAGYVANAPTQPLDSSYATLWWSWQRRYDAYNKRDVWLPPSGFIAQACAYTDDVAGPWFPIGGHNRGVLDTDKVEYSPDAAERETLVGGSNRVNPIVEFISGITLYGNRTLQRKESALADIHVRRLLVYAEKLVANSVRALVFEPNDPYTWRKFELLVNPILQHIKDSRGLEEFRVVCDATTNPSALRNQRRMNGKILLKPFGAAEVVEADFALFASGAEFTSNF